MKLILTAASLLASAAFAQEAVFGGAAPISGGSEVAWSNVVKDIDADDVITYSDSIETNSQPIQTPSEKDAEDAEIVEYKKRFAGIYDPNMYPYGPYHGDYRAPGSDDAVSDVIDLPSPFPFFNGQSTNKIRASTNGMIILDDRQIFESNPSELPSIEIDAPFVAGFWNDLWSKKHGRIYWRLEQFNDTLLAEMRDDIVRGFPEMEYMGTLKYCFIFTFWRVTHYGAKKSNGPQNTFQMVITTDGKYSFLINNYQSLEWNLAVGTSNKAVAGFDVSDEYFTMLEGSLTDSSISGDKAWNKLSTNSDIGGRHIFRLDEMEPPTTVAPPVTTPVAPGEPGEVTAVQIWPSNDNTLGGGIFKFIPDETIANGTCTLTFPNPPAWFHVFDAHIRADDAVTSTTWKICAANPTFEPNQDDGSFTFALHFNRGFEFTEEDIIMTCSSVDEYEYAVYSFPQNALQQQGRSNIRKKDSQWDPTAAYALTFPSPVGNFTLDDDRIQAATTDNTNFILTEVPDTIQEIWFQFDYINYFGSNEVGVVG